VSLSAQAVEAEPDGDPDLASACFRGAWGAAYAELVRGGIAAAFARAQGGKRVSDQ